MNVVFKIVYAFGWSITLLPLSVLYLLSDALYPVLFYGIRYRRKVVKTNLLHSFPELSTAELRKIEKAFYKQFCDVFIESIYLMHPHKNEIIKRFVFENTDVIINQIKSGKSVLIMSAHHGNWEWGISFPLHVPNEIKSFQVYKQLSNNTFDSFMNHLRSQFGGINVEMQSLSRFMVQMRNQQTNGVYFMISDQSPNALNRYWTTFLHQDTSVITGTEVLAKKFDYPVFYVEINRVERGHYQVKFLPITLEPNNTEKFEITEKYIHLLEETIKNQPETWLWTHRRWKHKRTIHNS